MAKRRTRRASREPNRSNVRTGAGGITGALGAAIESSRVPQVLAGAVNGLEALAVGALQLARNVLVSAASGAAEVGTEAIGATMSGARGIVAATSRMVADIATTAQTTLQDAMSNGRWSRNGGARTLASRRSSTPASNAAEAVTATSPSTEAAGSRRRGARARKTRQPRASVAA